MKLKRVQGLLEELCMTYSLGAVHSEVCSSDIRDFRAELEIILGRRQTRKDLAMVRQGLLALAEKREAIERLYERASILNAELEKETA